MRRIVALVLLSAFLLQTSGAAMAGPIPSVSIGPAISGLAAGVRSVAATFTTTPLFALITGNLNSYGLMHASLPDFSRVPRTMLISPESTRVIPHVNAQFTAGGGFAPSLPFPAAFSRMRLVDPLSTRAHSVQARSATTSNAFRASLVIHKGYITITPASITGAAGTSGSVTITCYAYDLDTGAYDVADCPALTITSSNGSVATMDSGGNVSFLGAGVATITAAAALDTSGTLSVTVTAGTPTPAPTPTPTPAPTPCPSGWSGFPPNCISPTPTPQPTTTPAPPQTTSTTGLNPWWTYEEGGIPGAGKWMLNVANGDLVVQDDDIDVRERGIDLAFRRTYNSQSQHDYANTDGSVPSNYGNGWTSTFDAHMGYNAASGKLSVYDIDGARYDYCSDGAGGWTSCTAGMHDTLVWDGGCGYRWTKKTGVVYYFYSPTGGCGIGAAMNGRIFYIFARNLNNWIHFSYAFTNSDASSYRNLWQITATHQDGQALTLTFADFAGNRLLSSIARPDGQTVTYQYDTNANLTDVYEIGNNAATNATPIHHQYGWAANHQMILANSPNWVLNNPAYPGSYVTFAYDGSGRGTQVQYTGLVNFTPNLDGTGWPLQSGQTTAQLYRSELFTYAAGQTTYSDTDGHATIYTYDGAGREATRQALAGSSYLVSTVAWDSDNNVVATVDPRGAATGQPSVYETDYAYDANGNTIAVALPAVGGIRPITLYSYERTNGANNVIAQCDPNYTSGLYRTWPISPAQSDSLCPNAPGVTRYSYSYTDDEPYGRLVSLSSPCYQNSTCLHPGKHSLLTYDSGVAGGGGDFGLPTSATMDCFTGYDGSPQGPQVCPQQTFTYDPLGNLATYNRGSGAWTLSYTNNRLTTIVDPDGVTTHKCYYADGSLNAVQSHIQWIADSGQICGQNSSAYTYDPDGNKLTELHHYESIPGTTKNWYDGDDRLVEVGLPHDATDVYPTAWLTRNIYDISQGAPLMAASVSGIYGRGNLYKTQEWLNSTWTDLKADSFDTLDRGVAHYQYQPGTNNFARSTSGYDQVASVTGFLSSSIDALGVSTYYNYDADGRKFATSYAGDGGVTAAETASYDLDSHLTSMLSSTLGAEVSTFDADGDLTTSQEPSGGAMTSPAKYTYSYFPTGERASLSVVSTALTQTNLVQYGYRADGMRSRVTFTDGGTTADMTYGRSPAGRIRTVADSSGQATRTITYGSDGAETTDAMASGTTSNIYHDNEGLITAFTPPTGTQSATIRYTARGEYEEQYWGASPCVNWNGGVGGGDPIYQAIRQDSANGYMVAKTQINCDSWANLNPLYDARTGVGLGSSNTDSQGNGTSVSYAFDADGRQTTASQTWQYSHPCGQDICPQQGTGSRVRVYDAENHLISDNVGAWDTGGGALSGCLTNVVREENVPNFAGGTWTYSWGPNGHPMVWNIQGVSYTVHWDGDHPLFITSSGTNVAEVKVETAGFYVPGGTFKYLDRNQAGFVVASHWSGGHSTWTPADAQHQTCDSADFSGAVLFEPGVDGVGDGANVIQGVRDYDPATGQWTSPDAYAGSASDPMSQKAFMWNRNNSMAYSDPSGYCTEPVVCEAAESDNSSNTIVAQATALKTIAKVITPKRVKAVAKKVVEFVLIKALSKAEEQTLQNILDAGHYEGSYSVTGNTIQFDNNDAMRAMVQGAQMWDNSPLGGFSEGAEIILDIADVDTYGAPAAGELITRFLGAVAGFASYMFYGSFRQRQQQQYRAWRASLEP